MHKEKNRKKPFLEIKNAVINDQDDDSSKAQAGCGVHCIHNVPFYLQIVRFMKGGKKEKKD